MTACRVIVNADDFGLSLGTSRGILRAHREGVVTSTTLMANMPDAPAALAMAAEAPGLGVGLHLNASQGRALSGAKALGLSADGVMNRTAAKVVGACAVSRAAFEAVVTEFEAQIRWALDHGLRPTHLDSHRHVHAWPPLFRRVVGLAKRYGIGGVRRVREAWPGNRRPAPCGPHDRKRRVLNLFDRVSLWLCGKRAATTGTWGIEHTGAIDADWFVGAAALLPEGVTELMVHPGEPEDLAPGLTRLRESRRVELSALCDPRVRAAFRERGAVFIHYGGI